jgi:DNA-binding response OmpR family regulator
MKILLAEDDTLILKTMELFLKKEGYEVICSKDGLDAVEKIDTMFPEMIVVDIMLPYFSGLEIVGKVKQGPRPVPMIVISAMGQQSVVDEAMKLGADDYISKPFNIAQLKASLKQLTKAEVLEKAQEQPNFVND